MAISFIAMSHICEDCCIEGKNGDCGGIKCRLRLLEIEENDQKVYIL